MKKIGLLILVLLVLSQFFRPTKNNTAHTDINTIPEDVKADLKVACYDCHSNQTEYPWYSNIQPIAWWMNKHIKNGKQKLNFDDVIKQKRYKDIVETIEEKEMPLKSYTIIHQDANLDVAQKERIIAWAKSKQ